MASETITVLFNDLVGSTEILSRLGGAGADELRRELFGLLRTAVDDAGGREVKNLGDGLMVAFTVAADAVECAVAMQQAVAARAERSEPLEIRVGIAVGDAEVEGDDYFGLPVVEAARLCGRAEGGEILITSLVRGMARSRRDLEFDLVGPLELKGLAEPVETWRVRWTPLPPAQDADPDQTTAVSVPGLAVSLLGPVEVRLDGAVIAVAGAKQRAMLAALALRANRVVSIAALVESIWGDGAPAGAEHTLQQHVSSFRKQIQRGGGDAKGAEVLVTQSPGYQLRVASVDVQRFEEATSSGLAASAAGRWADAVDAYTAALALWRGPALADARDSHALGAASARLDGQELMVREKRIEAMLACDRAPEVVPELEHLITEHPAREGLWALLMRALYRSGRQADALAAFQRARAELVDELGIEPGAELRDLEQAILVQSPSLDRPAPASPASNDLLRTTFHANGSATAGRIELPDGQLVMLTEGANLLGRDPSAIVRLVDNRVSRMHARIDVGGSTCRLHDLASSNGTFVNDRPITEHDLADGDVISLGGVFVRFRVPTS